MTILKDWLLGVTAAAILLALAGSLIPKGTVRQMGKLTGGLVLMTAILQPILKLDYQTLAGSLSRYREDLGGYEAEAQIENVRLMKSIIEAKSAAYIQDKAADLGIQCQVTVTCDAQTEEQYPYPTAVTVEGSLTNAEIQQLRRLIEADLAVPAQAQTYPEESGEIP